MADPVERARQAAQDHTFGAFNIEKADEVIGVEVTENPEEIAINAGNIEQRALQEVSGDTEAADHFGTIAQSAPTWMSMDVEQELLNTADAAESEPELIVGGNLFASTGEDLLCTTTSFASAPLFERTCDRVLEITTATCTQTADIKVTARQQFTCVVESNDADVNCTALEAIEQCVVAEEVCTDFGLDGCIETNKTFACASDAPLEVSALSAGPVEYDDPEITWESQCSAEYEAASCGVTANTCPDGGASVLVNGVLVTLQCEHPVTEYECALESYQTSCDVFQGADGCSMTSSSCILENPDGTCGTFEDTYTCGTEEASFDASCEDVNVCVAGVCQPVENEANNDFPKAAAYVGILNDMSANWTRSEAITTKECDREGGCTTLVVKAGGEIQYFTGRQASCRDAILGTLDCCKDSGWANGLFADCNESELALMAALEAGRAVYLYTYCSKKTLFFCRVKSRMYCVYNSKLGRVLSQEVQRVLRTPYACRPLTQDELEIVDFSQIDLSPVYADMLDKATVPNPEALSDALWDNITDTMPVTQENYQP